MIRLHASPISYNYAMAAVENHLTSEAKYQYNVHVHVHGISGWSVTYKKAASSGRQMPPEKRASQRQWTVTRVWRDITTAPRTHRHEQVHASRQSGPRNSMTNTKLTTRVAPGEARRMMGSSCCLWRGRNIGHCLTQEIDNCDLLFLIFFFIKDSP